MLYILNVPDNGDTKRIKLNHSLSSINNVSCHTINNCNILKKKMIDKEL